VDPENDWYIGGTYWGASSIGPETFSKTVGTQDAMLVS